MKVKLSIGEYVSWKWENENDIDRMREFAEKVYIDGNWKGIKEELRCMSDIEEGYLPSHIFVEGFEEALKLCGSENPEYELNPQGCTEVEIEWVD